MLISGNEVIMLMTTSLVVDISLQFVINVRKLAGGDEDDHASPAPDPASETSKPDSLTTTEEQHTTGKLYKH